MLYSFAPKLKSGRKLPGPPEYRPNSLGRRTKTITRSPIAPYPQRKSDVMAEKKDPPYFMYFPGNYRWSAAFINMLSSAPYGGSEIGELHKIGTLLKGKAP